MGEEEEEQEEREVGEEEEEQWYYESRSNHSSVWGIEGVLCAPLVGMLLVLLVLVC